MGGHEMPLHPVATAEADPDAEVGLRGRSPGCSPRVLALNKRPYCTARLPIIGDPVIDDELSQIINRAFVGDCGGAPYVANQGEGPQVPYLNPLELLADVRRVLG